MPTTAPTIELTLDLDDAYRLLTALDADGADYETPIYRTLCDEIDRAERTAHPIERPTDADLRADEALVDGHLGERAP